MIEEIKQLILDNYTLLLSIGAIFLVTVLGAMLSTRLFRMAIKKSEEVGDSNLTNLKFLKRGINVLIYIVGIGLAIYVIPSLRFLAKSMFASAGLLAIAIGFAAQQALSNIVGGIFIVIFKPYKIGDRIQVKTDLMGVIEDINLRHTVIRNYENKRIIIPNSVISNEVVINSNYADSKIIKWIDMSISYDSDIDLARKIMQAEVQAHPNFIDGRTPEQLANEDPLVPVRVMSMGESSVNLRAWAWAEEPSKAFVMGTELLESIKKRFDKEGVEIPYPHRTIVYKEKPGSDG